MGHSVFDLQFDDDNPFIETMVRATRLIDSVQPEVVVSHEEFAALAAAKIHKLPTLFITDWFLPGDHVTTSCLACADRVLFIEARGIFPEPEALRGRVEYLGAIKRPLKYTPKDRLRARLELSVDDHTLLISVIPGAWANESRAPIFDFVCSAVDGLQVPVKVIWIAGADYDELLLRGRSYEWLQLYRSYMPIEQVMVASDLVITKGNRGTTLDAAACGVPTISLTEGVNPVDELIVRRIPTNESIWVSGIDDSYLALRMLAAANGYKHRRLAGEAHAMTGEADNSNLERVANKLIGFGDATIRRPGATR
jgi:UDP-N-acetylglucosamine:LPS N-acetylglucosamine transferase